MGSGVGDNVSEMEIEGWTQMETQKETLRETQMGESQRGEFSIDQIEELSLYT